MKQLNWWKSIASFLVVLFTMPLGHALMMIMDKTMTPEAVHYSAFFMGLAGLIMVVIGVFVKGDTKQTLSAFLDRLDRISVPVLCYPLGYTAGDGEWRSCDSP